MKILLIQPAKSPVTLGGEDVFLYEPLALEYVAAGVAADHDVRILDLRLEDDLQGVLNDFCPDVVGITAYTVHVNAVKRLVEEIKAWGAEVLTVVGGHHATVAPRDFLSPFIDLIVLGEGVAAFQKIITRLEAGDDFQGIPGVAFKNGDGLIQTEQSLGVDLDATPFPDRTLTAKYRNHYYSEWMKPLASMRTSKGCPYRCNFCALWKLAGGRYLRRRPEEVVEELAGIDEPFVFFADDESLVDAPRMKKLAGLIREAGLKKRYFLYGRSDTIARNPDLLEMWREVGLERVFVGLEFFRDQDLEYIRKRSTTADNERAVKILHDLDVDIHASFIIRPEFSREDFAAFRQYCRGLRLNYASFAVLTPLPGTDLYEEVESRLITRDYDLFDFIHTLLPTRLSLEDFYAEYDDLYRGAFRLKDGLALLRKYPLRELPSTLVKSYRWHKRLRAAYLDYCSAPCEAASSSR